jgi:hypothetical protein
MRIEHVRREAERHPTRNRAARNGSRVGIRWQAGSCRAAALALGLVAACHSGSGSPVGSGSGAGSGSGIGGTSSPGVLFTNNPPTPGVGQGGKVVGILEIQAPRTQSLVLRGTLPVPKGTYPRADDLQPFSIRNWDGLVAPTQVEVVSRYPNDNDGADVVEVIARVDVAPGTAPDATLHYEIVEHPHAIEPLALKNHVMQLVTNPGMAYVVAKDCFGHQYKVDLFEDVVTGPTQPGNTELLRAGQGAVTFRTYGTMEPENATVGAPTGALAHLFGVHAYATTWAWTDSISLDLRVNNAASGDDKSSPEDDPLGKAYFKSLELWVPSGWTVVPDVVDPFFGSSRNEGNWTAYELVRPMSGGKLHMMPSQSSLHRRVTLTTFGNEVQAQSIVDEEWLGFCRRGASPTGGELYSWWNHQTSAYYPQRHRLPELDYLGLSQIRSKVGQAFSASRNVLTSGNGTGNYPYDESVLGWAHPWGVKYGGMTGGSEIFMYDGFLVAESADRRGYKHAQNTHRMYVSRQPDKLYDKDGEPTAVEDWLINGSQGKYVSMNFFQVLMSGPDPFGLTKSAGFQRNWVSTYGLQPGYENQLLQYSPIDFQHYVRINRSPKTLAWLGNDMLAKDDLRANAELFRLSYHEYPTSAGGAIIGSGLLADMNKANNHPGTGLWFGRGESWGLDSAMAAYSTGDDAYRAMTRPWFGKVADTIVQGQSSCNGVIQSTVNNKWLGGNFRARQSIEQAITENMLYGMVASVFRDADPGRTASLDYALSKSTQAMIGPMCWSTGANGGIGPHSYMAVAPLASNQLPFCGTLPQGGFGNGIDKYQVWSSFAYGLEKTGNSTFLTKAGQMAGGPGTLWNKMTSMNFNNLENRMALLADLQ